MSTEIRTCRLCGERAHISRLLKYGTRCYAHFECFICGKSVDDMKALPDWPRRQLEQFLANTPDITVLGFSDPKLLHNTIKDAIDE